MLCMIFVMITTKNVTEDIQNMQEEVKKENTATGKEATERLWVGWDSEDTSVMRIYSQQ